MATSNTTPTRRDVLRRLTMAPAALLAGLGRSSGAQAGEGSTPRHQVITVTAAHANPSAHHAVLVVADWDIPEQAVRRQCEVFAQEGLRTLGLRVASCTTIIGVYGHAITCDALIGHWLEDFTTVKTITLLCWCPLASPLRYLPMATHAGALQLRLHGPAPRAGDGCPDHAETGEFITPDDVHHGFDCADSETPVFVPDNTPLALAARRFFKSMRRDTRPWGASHRGSLDLEPLHYDALPLVNGFVMGEADDDPRLG